MSANARVTDLTAAAVTVLRTADPADKTRRTGQIAADWAEGRLAAIGTTRPPVHPARPDRPIVLPPKAMPKRRRAGSPAGRVALLHALAHIELNAIDLAWDLIARFTDDRWPDQFYADWVRVAAEEAVHFALLQDRLRALGSHYGALPAHGGLWLAAADTSDDALARLAIVPLVLEARGLDVTPAMIAALDRAGDDESVSVLRRIYDDEIGHVAIGRRWFDYLSRRRGLDPVATWQALVRQRFKGGLKPPFNAEARDRAGFPAHFYRPLAAG